ncbi:hypothetical protein D3C71_453790 [compost metagenome]
MPVGDPFFLPGMRHFQAETVVDAKGFEPSAVPAHEVRYRVRNILIVARSDACLIEVLKQGRRILEMVNPQSCVTVVSVSGAQVIPYEVEQFERLI